MNRTISLAGSLIAALATGLFAVSMLISFSFGSYVVCMILAMGYLMMAAGFCVESRVDDRAAAVCGMAFAVVYAVLILIVYFAQTTVVRLEVFSGEILRLLDYSRGGLMFDYDLLGYGMMALSTFFLGLSLRCESRTDIWLKRLMMIHGVFFFGCFIMPMTNVFSGMANGETSVGGIIALEFWCAYFIPVTILSAVHFSKKQV